jgi:ribonuclease J
MIRIVPLGGLGEIGMNCMVLDSDSEILIIDCGLMFSDLDHFGIEFVIPDFSYLLERKDKISAILVTHGHEDHIGAIPFLLKFGVQVPIYCSHFSSLLIQERANECGVTSKLDLRIFKTGELLKFKDFSVTPISVNHSIIESHALSIETPVGRIIHTGDFKIDPTPFYGSAIDLPAFQKLGDEGVLLLLSDSTNVERHNPTLSESVIYQKFEQLLAMAEGLTVVSTFASNIARIGQVLEIAAKMNKKVALAGRSMETNSRFGKSLGYLRSLDQTLIPLEDIEKYPRNQVVVLSTGSQGEYRSSLIRIANNEHKYIKLQKGDLVLMSSKFIPGNEVAIGRMINQLFKQGAEVLYESIHEIHTSGHATRPELKRMLEAVRPRFFVPIHGEYRHLVHHAALAKESGVADSNVLVATNGQVIELKADSIRIVEDRQDQRILLENRMGQDISRSILKERRRLAQGGAVFVLATRDAETQKIIAGPKVLTRAVAKEDREADYIENAEKIARSTVARYHEELRQNARVLDLQEELRIEVRRYFHDALGKKVTVIPFLIDL